MKTIMSTTQTMSLKVSWFDHRYQADLMKQNSKSVTKCSLSKFYSQIVYNNRSFVTPKLSLSQQIFI